MQRDVIASRLTDLPSGSPRHPQRPEHRAPTRPATLFTNTTGELLSNYCPIIALCAPGIACNGMILDLLPLRRHGPCASAVSTRLLGLSHGLSAPPPARQLAPTPGRNAGFTYMAYVEV